MTFKSFITEINEGMSLNDAAIKFIRDYNGDNPVKDWEKHKKELYNTGLITQDELKKWGVPNIITQTSVPAKWEKYVTRSLPAASQIKTEMFQKALKIQVITSVGAGIAQDVCSAEKMLKRNINDFIKDVEKEVKLKKVDKDVYVFVSCIDNHIVLSYTFTLGVGSKVEAKKLKKLDDLLITNKSRQHPMW